MKYSPTSEYWALLSRPMRATIFAVLTVGIASFASADSNQTALGDNFVDDVGGSERINLSGKLRMLSQRIPAAACYVDAGIKTETTTAMLNAAMDEFALIIGALQNGNPDIGIIGPEENARTNAVINRLNDLWTPFSDLAQQIAVGDHSEESLLLLQQQSEPVLEMAKLLVSQITSEYANPAALLFADAVVIDIAGRQRMLAQRTSKDICMLSAGIEVEGTLEDLAKTAKMFDTSIMALRDGLPAAGVRPPPTPEIAAHLDDDIMSWRLVQSKVDIVLAGQALNPDQLGVLFDEANNLTAGMNEAVALYAEASKMGL